MGHSIVLAVDLGTLGSDESLPLASEKKYANFTQMGDATPRSCSYIGGVVEARGKLGLLLRNIESRAGNHNHEHTCRRRSVIDSIIGSASAPGPAWPFEAMLNRAIGTSIKR
jgi:hypothetical protein